MADINLNIGSEELEGLKKLLAEIQKAADKLKKTIEQAGNITDDESLKAKRLAAEHKKVENAIKKEEQAADRMAVAQERVNQKTRETKGIIGSLEQQAKEFRSAMKSAGTAAELKQAQTGLRKVQTALQKAKGTTASWGKALGSFQFKFNALGNIAANVISRITSQMANFVKESTKAAAAAEGVERAFRKLNNPDLLNNLREATRNTVSDVNLMTAAVKANNFRIPLEQLPKFFEFASQRAIETGESVDYLVESIVLGVARKSIPILDNLGLSATEVREEFKKAGDMATAVANIIERDMGGANRPLATTAELYAQARANAENMKVQFGEISNLFITRMLPSANKFVDFLREALMTNDMIVRQQLDANIIYSIEQDRLEVQQLATSLEAHRSVLLKGQTYEQKAALLTLETYKTLLTSVEDTDVKRIETIASQIKALEIMAGIAPKADTLLDPGLWEKQKAAVDSFLESLLDFEDEDQDAVMPGYLKVPDAAVEKAKSNLEKIKENMDAAVQVEVSKDAEAAKAKTDAEDEKQRKTQATFELAKRATETFSDIFEAAKQRELSAVGDNAEKRAAIEKKYYRKQQVMAISAALIDGAQAFLKASLAAIPPANVPFMIASAAISAAQVGIIASQKFAKGGIDIKGPSHARGGIAAEIEGGESVINRRSTSKYKGLLDAINQDDQVRIQDALNRDRKIIIGGGGDPYNKKMYELMKETHNYGEDNQFYYKQVGNTIYKTKK